MKPPISDGISTPGRDMSPISRDGSQLRKNIFKSPVRSVNRLSRLSGLSPNRASEQGDAISEIERRFISVKEFQNLCRQVQNEYYKGNKYAETVTMQDLMPMFRKAVKVV